MDPGAHLLLTFDAAALPHVGLAHDDLLGEPFFVKRAPGCLPYTNIFDAIFLTVPQPVLFTSSFEKSVPKISKNRNADLILTHVRDDKVGIVSLVYIPKEQLHKNSSEKTTAQARPRCVRSHVHHHRDWMHGSWPRTRPDR